MSYELDFLIALFTTIAIETTVIFSILCFYEKGKFNRCTIFKAGVLPTVTTLPYVWFIFPYFASNWYVYLITVESFAVIVESFMIAWILNVELKKGFVFSFLANMTSAILGFFIFQ